MRLKNLTRITRAIATLLAIAFFCIGTAWGEESRTLNIDEGCIKITATGYIQSKENMDLPENAYTGDYIIKGMTKEYTISIEGGTHNITLDGLNIDLENIEDENYRKSCPFRIKDANVTLILANTNKLSAGYWTVNIWGSGIRYYSYPGINILDRSELTIQGDGSLDTQGGKGIDGCGIGKSATGIITINSGTITARGHSGVSNATPNGIEASKITINGGTVTTLGTVGIYGKTEVVINGGKVSATGGPYGTYWHGSGIKSEQTLIIKDGDVTATAGYDQKSYASLAIESPDITIEGGTIMAKVPQGGTPAIGASSNFNNREVKITISGGDITAIGGSYSSGSGAGIGAYTTGKSTILITGGTIVAKGGNANGNYAYTTGAGIGYQYNQEGSTITISGGTVKATGGDTPEAENSNRGLGLDAGSQGGITISGGVVTAIGGKDKTGKQASGIGNDAENNTCTFSTGEAGSAFIVTNNITDTKNQESWSGTIFNGTTGAVYSTMSLSTDVEIPDGYALEIPDGKTLTIEPNTTLTNWGDITIKTGGNLVNNGIINNGGSIIWENGETTGGIIKSPLTAEMVVLEPENPSYTYNGKANTPGVTVRGYEADKDYTIEYRNNINAGYYAQVVIAPVAKGSLFGEPVAKGFTIERATLTVTPKSGQILYRNEPIEYDMEGAAEGEMPLEGELYLEGSGDTRTIQGHLWLKDESWNNYDYPPSFIDGVTATYIDRDPATIDITLPDPDDNIDGWYTKDITFTAPDNFEIALTGSELKSDPEYGNSFVWSADGVYTISYNLRRPTTKAEYQHTKDIKLDKTAPALSATTSNLNYTLTFSDATTGIAKLTVDGVEISLAPDATTYSGTSTAGTHKAVATDKVGNETTISFSLGSYVPPVAYYYTVTLPAVEGVTLSRKPGGHTVEEGYSFSFTLKLDAEYDKSVPVVTTTRSETIEPDKNGKYVIRNVKEDIDISITGIFRNDDPTANASIQGEVQVKALGHTLYIYTPKEEAVFIYTATGYPLKRQMVTGSTHIGGLPAGIYFVRIKERRYKVMIR